MSRMVTITQFSDTHFSRPGNRSHAGFGYDTDEAWLASTSLAFADPTDLTVVTGDVADHGEADEYAVAVERLSTIPTPVNVLPGNHDFHIPLTATIPLKRSRPRFRPRNYGWKTRPNTETTFRPRPVACPGDGDKPTETST